jgi:hypothetical protein
LVWWIRVRQSLSHVHRQELLGPQQLLGLRVVLAAAVGDRQELAAAAAARLTVVLVDLPQLLLLAGW